MGVASLVLKPRLPKFVKSHNFKRYISDMISIKIVPLISDLGKTPLSVPSIFRGVLVLVDFTARGATDQGNSKSSKIHFKQENPF